MTRHVLTADALVIGILLAVLQCGSPPKGAAPPPEAELGELTDEGGAVVARFEARHME